MSERERDGLPPHLKEKLDTAVQESKRRQWSLNDIDALLLDVTASEAVPEEPAKASVEPPVAQEESLIVEEEPQVQAKDEISVDEVTEPAPHNESLRFDLFEDRKLTGFTLTLPVDDEPLMKDVVPQESTRRMPDIDEMSGDVWQSGEEQVVEKPGVLLKRVDMQMTTDLSPVPRVLPAAELLQRQRSPITPEEMEDIPEGQQRFPDFEADAPKELSEAELEAQLAQSREARANQFHTLRGLGKKLELSGETGEEMELPLFAEPETIEKDAGVGTPRFEFTDDKTRDPVFHALRRARSRRSSAMLALMVTAVLAAILQGVSVGIGADAPLYLGSMAFFFAAGLFICAGDLAHGFKAIIKRRPNADSLLLVAALLCTAQIVVLFLPYDHMIDRGTHATPLFLFLAAGYAVAKWMQARGRCDNFRFCAYTAMDHLYAVRLLSEGATPQRTAKQNLHDSKTAIPVPVERPANFVRESYRETAVDKICTWLLPLALGLAVLVGVAAALQTDGMGFESFGMGLTAATLAVCLCLPGYGLLVAATQMRALTKSSPENGVAILSAEAAEAGAKTAAVVLDSRNMYVPAKGRMHGWRDYWKVRTDEALLYAAGIAIAAGGPLQAVFEGVIEGDYAVLPEVRHMTYEDRMGLSCRIHNQPVFFGNRKLLENHGVTVALTEHDEKTYEHGGRKILYLAVEKQLTAFFVVSYTADPQLESPLLQLEREDVELLLCNSDPCVSEVALIEAFGMGRGSITLLRAAPSEAYREQMQALAQSGHSGVYHAANARAFLRAIAACMSLRNSGRRLRLFLLVGSLVANALLLGIALAGQMGSAMNGLLFIGWNVIWAAIMYTGTKS